MNPWKFLNLISFFALGLPNFIFKILWRSLDLLDGKAGAIFRYVLISKRLGDCGERVFIGPQVYISDCKNVFIGSRVSLHIGTVIISEGGVYIGNDVSIAHYSSLISTQHTWNNKSLPIKYNPVIASAISIENNIWIGAGVKILSGVVVGRGSILAAGAVINKSTEPHHLYAGVPAVKIKKIDTE